MNCQDKIHKNYFFTTRSFHLTNAEGEYSCRFFSTVLFNFEIKFTLEQRDGDKAV